MDKKSKILQKNGEIVFDALRSMEDAKTLTDIVNFVAASNNTEAEKIKGSVKEVLDAAVQYGFIKKQGYKYSVKPIDRGGSTSESDADAEPADSGRKRRRSRSGGRKRSRSRRRRMKF